MKKLHLFRKLRLFTCRNIFSKTALIVAPVLIINVICLSINAQDQANGGFAGVVRDKSTGKPISKAQVTIINQTNNFTVSTFTDEKGQFVKRTLPPGIYTIQFTAPGYQSLQLTEKMLLATRLNEILPPPGLEPIVKKDKPDLVRIPSSNRPKIKPLPTPQIKTLTTGNLAVASISNAEIIVQDLENKQIYKNKILSNELLCVFDQMPTKKYKVRASLEGYKPQEKEIEIQANQTIPLTLNLVPNETSSRILSQVGKYYALVIGNNDYKHLPKLKTAVEDAGAVDKILRDKFGFETKLLLDATREQIIVALNEYRKIGAEDNLIIYYAGHGHNDKEVGRAYWLPVDARTEDDANWISADDITANVRRLDARHVLVVSDSSYSGTISRSADLVLSARSKPTEREIYLLNMYKGKSRTLLASGGNEPVMDEGGGIYSVFAAALLIGFLEMEKDIFTAEELYFNHIKEKVAGKAEQTPEYNPLRNSGHESGGFVFVRKK